MSEGRRSWVAPDASGPPATGAPMSMVDGHARSIEDVAQALGVDPRHGLSGATIAERRALAGPNELEATEPPTLRAAVIEAVTEPFVLLLFVAGTLAAILGEVRDGLLILVGLLPIVGADVVTS